MEFGLTHTQLFCTDMHVRKSEEDTYLHSHPMEFNHSLHSVTELR